MTATTSVTTAEAGVVAQASKIQISEIVAASAWTKPEVSEICLGMEVTSYESAEIDILD